MFFIKLKSKAIRMQRKEHLLWTSCSCCLVASVVSNSLRPRGLQPARLLCPWDSPDKNTGVGCHSHLQQIFPTQGSNPHLLCLLHCRQIEPLGQAAMEKTQSQIPASPFTICINLNIFWKNFIGRSALIRAIKEKSLWNLWEKARVRWLERIVLKHVYYHMWNRWPVQVQCMRQGTQSQGTGTTLRDGMGREEERGSGWGAHVHPWLIHVNVWQKLLQYCKVTSLQLK